MVSRSTRKNGRKQSGGGFFSFFTRKKDDNKKEKKTCQFLQQCANKNFLKALLVIPF